MAKKQKAPEHVNLERWLVSYADFITLLFAFFVVMFAISQVDSRKLGRFTESVQAATRLGIFTQSGEPGPMMDAAGGRVSLERPINDSNRARPFRIGGKLAQLRRTLEKQLPSALSEGRVSLVETEEGLVVRLRDTAYFPSGSADLRADSTEELRTIGQWLSGVPNKVRIEGHTDSRPIRTSVYRSNWDLSAARAGSVLALLSDETGVSQERMSVAGYADRQPIATNDTDEGRQKNRRVDLIVLAADSEAAAPRGPVLGHSPGQ